MGLVLIEEVYCSKVPAKDDILKKYRQRMSCGLKKSSILYEKDGCEPKG